jgi:hypothetical protein
MILNAENNRRLFTFSNGIAFIWALYTVANTKGLCWFRYFVQLLKDNRNFAIEFWKIFKDSH